MLEEAPCARTRYCKLCVAPNLRTKTATSFSNIRYGLDFIFFTDELVWKLVDNILNTWSDRLLLCFAFISNWVVENGRYGHTPIRSDTRIRVYTTADTDTDTITPCFGVPATCNIRPGRSLRERSLYAMGGTCRPLATHKLARSVSFMTG